MKKPALRQICTFKIDTAIFYPYIISMDTTRGETSALTEDTVLKIMGSYGNDPQQLIAVLLDIQAASGKNYVDRKWAELTSRILAVPLSKIFDVLTFYAMFSTVPRGEYLIEICQSAPCRFSKAEQIVEWFEAAAGIKIGQTSADGRITLAHTSCVGSCEIGPVAKIGDNVFGNLTEEKVRALVDGCRKGNLQRVFSCQN